ncbi:G/T mismatch-specific thymine DNA glycosylase isoform X2 [Octopus sinensis]|uniref:G/T mismatch-specific thymine DNA glycosylase n=1 Tax=Octopus sinensis TaxID=2607531 RepID=A0A7E6EI35_9MOLL|nr:G/T mismatch-specific thymine DNA glycosylase isoform X2 [Octopus sinensis]
MFFRLMRKCLHLSELIPEPMTAYDDSKLLNHGIGFTNIVERTTRGSGDLSKKEIRDGGKQLLEKLKFYGPKIAVFNGKGIYEIFSGSKNFAFGKQPAKLEGTETTVFVMPSSSARCSQLPRAIDKVPFYVALRRLRDFLVGKIKTLDESEVCFPDLELKVKTEKVDKTEKAEKTPNSKKLKAPKIENPAYPLPPQGSTSSSSYVKPEPTYDTDDYGQMPMGKGLSAGVGQGAELGLSSEKGSEFAGAPPGTGMLSPSACAPPSTSTPPTSTTPSFQAMPFDMLSPPPPNQPVPVGMSEYTNYPQASYDYLPFPT